MILEKITNTIKRYGLINKGDRIVVGVSGGPDSLALLYLLNSLKKEFKLSLHIAHVDHMLRKDSAKDRKFVESLAGKLDIPLSSTRINIRKIAQKGSVEEIARNARLGFLFRVAREQGADKIALGHNLDDQAETVLMRILRGAGLYGLCGILPKRKISSFVIIRPLLEITRKEIEAFLKRKRASPRIDESNRQETYFRNKIRHRLLPYLEKEFNQNIKEVLSNMAQSIGSDYEYLSVVAARSIAKTGNKLDLESLRRKHPAIQRLIFRQEIARLKGDTRKIDFRHIKEIQELIAARPVNSVVDLPKKVSVVKRNKHLIFFLRNTR